MDKEQKERIAIAEFKLGLIAPAVNGTFTDPTMAAYFRRIAKEPLEFPDGTRTKINASTLSSWRRSYLKSGFEGLVPKARCDLGKSRRIDADLAKDIQAIRAEFPKISASMMLERLVEEGYIVKGEMSASTMQRFFKRHPVSSDGSAAKDRRAFESARVNGIWQADSLYGPYVGDPPKRAFLQAAIDDKSRKVVAARFVERDCAASFQATLKMAVASHGIPEKLFVDNGAPYKNGQLSFICGGLGIVLCHAQPRDGAAKGKIERFNRTLRMRFLSVLPEQAKCGIDELNLELAKWISKYNATVHRSTGRPPVETFADEADRLRYVSGGDKGIHDAFLNRVTRKVAQDATVRVEHVLYDVPMGMIGEKVELRFTPGDTDDVWIVMPDKTMRRITATDKQANAKAKRASLAYAIDFSKGQGE